MCSGSSAVEGSEGGIEDGCSGSPEVAFGCSAGAHFVAVHSP